MTLNARRDATALGLNRHGVAAIIRSMVRSHFYKSTTSFADHKQWQDVYRVPWDDRTLYVKFTADEVSEFRVLSFKEK